MNHSSYFSTGPGRDRHHHPEPRPAEPGQWPKLEAALAVVNRDVMATLPGQDALILMVVPPGQHSPPGGIDRGQVYVAMPDGRWHGNQVNVWDPEEDDPPEPHDAETVLATVADAAQSTIMELLWQAWPVCWEHKTGTHVRWPAATADFYEDPPDDAGPPVWWCRGGQGGIFHDVSLVGELAATLPGKQRRELRRSERKRNGGR
ncbi:hypothetical protein [Streptomyces graminilatus]|uniref:hypothetical protein n=1 Tax=Streptomyces graminilatus TaxID=1464070 RepID=UPI0006E1C22D|nr:hypothetical protein [Streptomyces graminilatus]